MEGRLTALLAWDGWECGEKRGMLHDSCIAVATGRGEGSGGLYKIWEMKRGKGKEGKGGGGGC